MKGGKISSLEQLETSLDSTFGPRLRGDLPSNFLADPPFVVSLVVSFVTFTASGKRISTVYWEMILSLRPLYLLSLLAP